MSFRLYTNPGCHSYIIPWLWCARAVSKCRFYLPLAVMLCSGCIRMVIRPNAVLLVHHIMYFVLTLVSISSQSVLVWKAGMVIDLFATYEFGLYIALLLRRLGAPIGRTRSAMGFGLGIYAVTRVVQFMILWLLFVDGYGLILSRKGWYWLELSLVIPLVCIQFYTFYIYGMMWQGLRASGKALVGVSAAGVDNSRPPSKVRSIRSTKKDGQL